MENPIKMDGLGVPLFLETPIYKHLCLNSRQHPFICRPQLHVWPVLESEWSQHLLGLQVLPSNVGPKVSWVVDLMDGGGAFAHKLCPTPMICSELRQSAAA